MDFWVIINSWYCRFKIILTLVWNFVQRNFIYYNLIIPLNNNPECVYENDKSARKAPNLRRQSEKERPLNLGSSINSGVQEIREVNRTTQQSNTEIREVIPQDEVQVVEQPKAKGRSTYYVCKCSWGEGWSKSRHRKGTPIKYVCGGA